MGIFGHFQKRFYYMDMWIKSLFEIESCVVCIEINYSRLIMPLALSRRILLRPRSEPSTVLGLGLYLHLWVCEHVLLVNNIPVSRTL